MFCERWVVVGDAQGILQSKSSKMSEHSILYGLKLVPVAKVNVENLQDLTDNLETQHADPEGDDDRG